MRTIVATVAVTIVTLTLAVPTGAAKSTITGTLVEIGLGRRPIGDTAEILTSRARELAGPTAPPHGLFLVSVDYSDA